VHWRTVGGMLGAWVVTLPVSAVIASVAYRVMESFG
jgi:phosphate/sulfate permease